jgi:hypothetical protein
MVHYLHLITEECDFHQLTKGRILNSRKDLSMKIIKKELWQKALRLKAKQTQQPQGHVALNLTREDIRRHKPRTSG